MNTKTEAIRGMNILKKKLGKGWKGRVWENLGWHYECLKGPISVYPAGSKYFVLMADDMKFVGCGFPGWKDQNGPYKNPRTAVHETLVLAEKYLERIESIVTMAKFCYINS